jgi:hypothetical protein
MKYDFRQRPRHRFLLVVADEIPLASLRLGSQCGEIRGIVAPGRQTAAW